MSRAKRWKRRRRARNEPNNFAPEVYDSLPNISLTIRAVRELNRRNKESRTERKLVIDPEIPTSIAHFARQGGPDLTDLRGVRAAVLSVVCAKSLTVSFCNSVVVPFATRIPL